MTQERHVTILERDCEAIAIPSGVQFTMEKGTEVVITQSLGESHTVMSHYGYSRIDKKNQDALGLASSTPAPAEKKVVSDAAVTEEQVWDVLRTVYDPEIPVNIVDLGLVYALELKKLEQGGYRADVKMTLTAPGCGMGPVIQADAKNRILALPGMAEAEVELVWNPPWTQEMITEIGRMKLGMI